MDLFPREELPIVCTYSSEEPFPCIQYDLTMQSAPKAQLVPEQCRSNFAELQASLATEVWFYVDGSTSGRQEFGGYGALGVTWPADKIFWQEFGPAGRWCSSFRAEVHAITITLSHASTMCDSGEISQGSHFAVATDSLSTINALARSPIQCRDVLLSRCWADLLRMSSQWSVTCTFVWVPSHMTIEFNEAVDELAAQGAKLDQASSV